MSERLGACTDALDRVADSLTAAGHTVLEIRTRAQHSMAELHTSWSGPDLALLGQRWDQQALPRLSAATTSMERCAAQLRAQSAEQRTASRAEAGGLGGTSSAPSLSPPTPSTPSTAPMPWAPSTPSPPAHGSPAENAIWWRSMSSGQQQQVISGHPRWIGNRDGVAFAARDLANRALLGVDRADLQARRQGLVADLADNWFGGALTNNDAALDQVQAKLAALDALETTLDPEVNPGQRQLLLLDMSQERTQAAIARGDVDNADSVAVFVPGLSANVTGIAGYRQEMDQMQRRAVLESERVDVHGSAATVTWVGYQAPQMGSDLLGANSVADVDAARRGAASLVPFLQGIGAARSRDAHLTVLAHSYGSTTVGLALREQTGVDDVVFFGSPGLGTSHVEDLQVGAGHAYYIEARQDAVGDLGYFGVDPSHLAGIQHLSAKQSTVVDQATGQIRHLREVTGHSSYLRQDSTSQYNMSVVVAGVPERSVSDAGEGVGDVLSWPIPGTVR